MHNMKYSDDLSVPHVKENCMCRSAESDESNSMSDHNAIFATVDPHLSEQKGQFEQKVISDDEGCEEVRSRIEVRVHGDHAWEHGAREYHQRHESLCGL